jgi:hypothetical protein
MKIAVGPLVFDLPPDLAFHKARMLARAGRPVKIGPSWSTSLRPPR